MMDRISEDPPEKEPTGYMHGRVYILRNQYMQLGGLQVQNRQGSPRLQTQGRAESLSLGTVWRQNAFFLGDPSRGSPTLWRVSCSTQRPPIEM